MSVTGNCCEVAKLFHGGSFISKEGAVPGVDHRALRRLGGNFETISAIDDNWAEACHFDFVSRFGASGAVALRAH